MKIWSDIKWFYNQMKRSLAYAKHAWGGYDWDYSYSIKMFQYSLERLATKLASNSSYSSDAKSRAIRCKMIAKLMERVNEDYYATSYIGVLESNYGRCEMVTKKLDNDSYELVDWRWEKAVDDKHNNEINEVSRELMKWSNEKQKRAEILLWKLVAHNIKYFWD